MTAGKDREAVRQRTAPDALTCTAGTVHRESACYCLYFIFASLTQASLALPDRLSQRSLAAL